MIHFTKMLLKNISKNFTMTSSKFSYISNITRITNSILRKKNQWRLMINNFSKKKIYIVANHTTSILRWKCFFLRSFIASTLLTKWKWNARYKHWRKIVCKLQKSFRDSLIHEIRKITTITCEWNRNYEISNWRCFLRNKWKNCICWFEKSKSNYKQKITTNANKFEIIV